MPSRLRTTRSLLPVATFALLFAAPLRAQDASLVPSRTVDSVTVVPAAAASATPAGPTVESASVGVRHVSTAASTTPAQATRQGLGKPIALMAVGGAAILAGLLIGGGAGYAIAVGGAVVGLYGLYQYVQ